MTDEASAFVAGKSIMIETADDGLEAGTLVGASMFGLLYRATHRMEPVPVSDEEREEILAEADIEEDAEDVEITRTAMMPLARTVLTLLPWTEVKKVELAEELLEDATLREFREALDVMDRIEPDDDLSDDLDLDDDGDEDSDGDD